MNPESPAAPETLGRTEDAVVRIPDGDTIPVRVTSTQRPWFRRWYTYAGIALVFAGLAAGLTLTVFHHSSASSANATPSSILQDDGYSVMMTATKAQMAQMGAFNTPNASVVEPYIISAAFGTKGNQAEYAYQMDPNFSKVMNLGLPLAEQKLGKDLGLPPGVTVHMDGNFLILDGPTSTLEGN